MTCRVIVEMFLKLKSSNMARMTISSRCQNRQSGKDFVINCHDSTLGCPRAGFQPLFENLLHWSTSWKTAVKNTAPFTNNFKVSMSFVTREKLNVLRKVKKMTFPIWVLGSKDLNTFQINTFTTWTQLCFSQPPYWSCSDLYKSLIINEVRKDSIWSWLVFKVCFHKTQANNEKKIWNHGSNVSEMMVCLVLTL